MQSLFARLAPRVAAWREAEYPCEAYPAVGELLAWAALADDARTLRFLRSPQVKALETYWFLRLIEDTPRVVDLYRRVFPRQSELLQSLGLGTEPIQKVVIKQ